MVKFYRPKEPSKFFTSQKNLSLVSLWKLILKKMLCDGDLLSFAYVCLSQIRLFLKNVIDSCRLKLKSYFALLGSKIDHKQRINCQSEELPMQLWRPKIARLQVNLQFIFLLSTIVITSYK